ncbi:hypothetical protein V8D89_002914 [Ganoderma adspersum]
MRDMSLPDNVEAAPPPSPQPHSAPPHGRTIHFQCLAEAAEPHALFTPAERALEDFDAGALVGSLPVSTPTIQGAFVSMSRPSRCGGGM